jgi:hypothetical protein
VNLALRRNGLTEAVIVDDVMVSFAAPLENVDHTEHVLGWGSRAGN